jgi:hypothetical protein
VQKPCNVNVKYTDPVSEWSHNFPAANRKGHLRHFNSYQVIIIHLATGWNEMKQGSVHGSPSDISLSFDGPEVNSPLHGNILSLNLPHNHAMLYL